MLCPICSAKSNVVVETKKGFGILRCSECTAVFAAPTPSEKTLAEFYQGFMFSRPHGEQQKMFVQRACQGAAAFLPVVEELRDGKVARILDFGGGVGFYANAVSGDSDVTLFDLDSNARAFAQEAFGETIKVVATAEAALNGGPYDLIILNQVIEHVPDPVAFVAGLRPALAEGGIIAVTTPNNSRMLPFLQPDSAKAYVGRATGNKLVNAAKLLTNSWVACDPPRHLFAFNATSLSTTMQRAGFVPKLVTTFSWKNDPFGYPRYGRRAGRRRGIGRAIVNLYVEGADYVARVFDRKRKHLSTLVGYYTPA